MRDSKQLQREEWKNSYFCLGLSSNDIYTRNQLNYFFVLQINTESENSRKLSLFYIRQNINFIDTVLKKYMILCFFLHIRYTNKRLWCQTWKCVYCINLRQSRLYYKNKQYWASSFNGSLYILPSTGTIFRRKGVSYFGTLDHTKKQKKNRQNTLKNAINAQKFTGPQIKKNWWSNRSKLQF